MPHSPGRYSTLNDYLIDFEECIYIKYSPGRYSTLNDYLIGSEECTYIKYLHEWYTTIYEYVNKFEEIISTRHVNFKATVFEYIMQSYVRCFTNGSQFSSGQLLVTDFSALSVFQRLGASNIFTWPHSLCRTFNSAPHSYVPTLNRSAPSSSIVREKVVKYIKQARRRGIQNQ